MSTPRHKASSRPAARAWFKKIVGPAVVSTSLTAMVVTVGVASVGSTPGTGVDEAGALTQTNTAALSGATLKALEQSRGVTVSRSAKRTTLTPKATGHKYATAALNVWTGPGEATKKVGLIKFGTKLAVTGNVKGHWAEILVKDDVVRWVNNDYLAKKKPSASASASGSAVSGISGAPCADGSSIEAGLTSSAIRLYRGVCAAFPALSTYGGRDGHGEHVDGRAIDFMITDSNLGQAVANWILANASALSIRDIIWSQHIWTPEQSSAGWRYMSDRGSATANHYDHVHVAVF